MNCNPTSPSAVAGIKQVWVTVPGFNVVSPGWYRRCQGQENLEVGWLLGGL